MNSGKSKKAENLTAELVIIGGGGAGITAAVAAAENGIKDIIVLEKRHALGGNTIRAGGLFACESPIQRREMVIADKDELFKTFMNWNHWNKVDPRIVRAYINKSGDTIRWLQEKGIDFELRGLYPNQLRVGHIPSEGGGYQLIKTLVGNCQNMGVQLLLRTKAKRIIRGVKNDLIDIVVENEAGKEFKITCKSVIIATGGFGGSKQLLKKYCPDYYDGMRLQGFAHTGDGLLMATEMGAAIGDRIPLLREGPTPDCGENLILKFTVLEPYTIWLNKRGQRFIDESTGGMAFVSGNAILRQPDKVVYTIFDSEIKKLLEGKRFHLRGGKHKEAKTYGTSVLERELQKQAESGFLKIADSWEEIAEWIGADPQILKASVDEYNRFCESGYDELFAKERRYLLSLKKPPFYAIRCVTAFLDTLGGIKVNERMDVLDKQDNPIPGVYAAGVIADGLQSEMYCSELSGSAFGFAINSGRIAAENAARYIGGNY